MSMSVYTGGRTKIFGEAAPSGITICYALYALDPHEWTRGLWVMFKYNGSEFLRIGMESPGDAPRAEFSIMNQVPRDMTYRICALAFSEHIFQDDDFRQFAREHASRYLWEYQHALRCEQCRAVLYGADVGPPCEKCTENLTAGPFRSYEDPAGTGDILYEHTDPRKR